MVCFGFCRGGPGGAVRLQKLSSTWKTFVSPTPVVFDPTVFVVVMGLITPLQTKLGHQAVFFFIFLDEGKKSRVES